MISMCTDIVVFFGATRANRFSRRHFWKKQENTIPIHADAYDLSYEQEYLDAIVSIDAFHYFATQENYF